MIEAVDLDPSHHVFRHIKKTWMEGDFIEPAAFRLREKDGVYEPGLSVNWVEYFATPTPADAVAPLKILLEKKGRTVAGSSKFALLNVASIKAAASQYAPVQVVHDREDNDRSHALVTGYEAFNDQVAEELSRVVIAAYQAKS